MFFFPHDVDRIEFLKALPVRSVAYAWGELSGIVVLMSALEALFFLLMAIWFREGAAILVAAALFVIPVNLVLFAVEKFVFLIYPFRMVPNTPGQYQHASRQLIFTLVKSLTLGACYVPVIALGLVAYFVLDHSWIAFATVSWVLVVAEVFGLIQLVAWAFRRYDPSLDTPGA
jgi:hypothetical protein